MHGARDRHVDLRGLPIDQKRGGRAPGRAQGGPVAGRQLQPHGRGVERGQVPPSDSRGVRDGGAADVARAGGGAHAGLRGHGAGLGVHEGTPLRRERRVRGLGHDWRPGGTSATTAGGCVEEVCQRDRGRQIDRHFGRDRGTQPHVVEGGDVHGDPRARGQAVGHVDARRRQAAVRGHRPGRQAEGDVVRRTSYVVRVDAAVGVREHAAPAQRRRPVHEERAGGVRGLHRQTAVQHRRGAGVQHRPGPLAPLPVGVESHGTILPRRPKMR